MLPAAVAMGSSEAHLPEPEDIEPQRLTDQVADLVGVDQELKTTLGFGLDALVAAGAALGLSVGDLIPPRHDGGLWFGRLDDGLRPGFGPCRWFRF